MEEKTMIPESAKGMEYLVNLGRERTDIPTVTIDGETYTNSNLVRIPKVPAPRPACFTTATLHGLVEFLLADVDGILDQFSSVLVNVESPTRVVVYSPFYGDEKKRDVIARCEVNPSSLNTDCYMDAEDFNVMIQTKVVQSPNRDLVLKFVGSMRDEQSNAVADDGFSQRVTVKTGVAQVGDVTIVNPVSLAPRRTFPEISQPESPFILRLKEGPCAALFSCNDNEWKNDAIFSIGCYLRGFLSHHAETDDPRFVVIAG